jgi:hypothetical protein
VQATESVNEAYLRLLDVQQVDWQDRTHFMAISARLMRRVLVDLARARGADKRGGGAVRVTARSTSAISMARNPGVWSMPSWPTCIPRRVGCSSFGRVRSFRNISI